MINTSSIKCLIKIRKVARPLNRSGKFHEGCYTDIIFVIAFVELLNSNFDLDSRYVTKVIKF